MQLKSLISYAKCFCTSRNWVEQCTNLSWVVTLPATLEISVSPYSWNSSRGRNLGSTSNIAETLMHIPMVLESECVVALKMIRTEVAVCMCACSLVDYNCTVFLLIILYFAAAVISVAFSQTYFLFSWQELVLIPESNCSWHPSISHSSKYCPWDAIF